MEENEELENDKDKEVSQSTNANKDKEVSQSTDASEVDANSTMNNEDELLQGEGVRHIETKETDDFFGQPSLA